MILYLSCVSYIDTSVSYVVVRSAAMHARRSMESPSWVYTQLSAIYCAAVARGPGPNHWRNWDQPVISDPDGYDVKTLQTRWKPNWSLVLEDRSKKISQPMRVENCSKKIAEVGEEVHRRSPQENFPTKVRRRLLKEDCGNRRRSPSKIAPPLSQVKKWGYATARSSGP